MVGYESERVVNGAAGVFHIRDASGLRNVPVALNHDDNHEEERELEGPTGSEARRHLWTIKVFPTDWDVGALDLGTRPLDLDVHSIDSDGHVWEPVVDGSDLESKRRSESYLVNGMLRQDVENGYGENPACQSRRRLDRIGYSARNHSDVVDIKTSAGVQPSIANWSLTRVLSTILQATADFRIHVS
ncbi:hypothetical protein FRC09_018924 [Ceratobasidium sp. 395]|nr:hypothetical protein FRC09_018924 [Ceratobasidium sp. 395]